MVRMSDYFQKHRYRDPNEGVVAAYVLPKLEFILNNINLRRESKILDVGCGNGTFTYYFQKMYKHIYGTDMSIFQLKTNSCSNLICAGAYKLPFKDNSFDLVFSANLFHHLESPALAIQEMKRVSRRFLGFIEPNRLNPMMFLFSLVVSEERGTRKSSLGIWRKMSEKLNLNVLNSMTTGMITQQNTPPKLVPLLRHFDFNFIFGAYSVLVCEVEKQL
ncbi:MAG: methyltransferase domain-containing protein [Candidatus Omnitrophica bacterium]|nr:methyltransferase domain-containing protein [Candidatus Omnitrophota bacterium]